MVFQRFRKSHSQHMIYNTFLILFYVFSADWRYRHAGLMAISAVGEGCHKQMLNMLPNLVDSILPFLTDQHPRVRYAACNALGQLSTDFAEGFQTKFHSKVKYCW